MNKPLVSVIIPNYNRGHLIEGVIDSVNNQTYQNIEIIVVDDHSTDNSWNKLLELQTMVQKLTIHRLSQNKGANFCRNKGVELAKGEFIAFLDSDDYFLPTKIEKQMGIFEQFPKISFVTTGFGANTLHILGEGFIPIKETIKQNNLGGFSTLMIKKEIFLQVGGLDNQLLSCQDWDLFLKILQISNGYKIREDLVIYEAQSDSISKNSLKVIQGYKIVALRAQVINDKLKIIPPDELLSYQEYYLAMRYFGLKDIKNTRKHLKQSIKIKPTPLPIVYSLVALFGYHSLHFLIYVKNGYKILRNKF